MTIPIQPQVRAILYWVWIGLYLAVLIADAVFRVIGGTPEWLGPLAEWLLLVGVFVGFVAAGHTVSVDQTALPSTVRKVIYLALSTLSLIVFILSEGFRIIGGPGDPWWIDLANGILIILGTAFGFTAASHVVPNPPPADVAQPESPGVAYPLG